MDNCEMQDFNRGIVSTKEHSYKHKLLADHSQSSQLIKVDDDAPDN